MKSHNALPPGTREHRADEAMKVIVAAALAGERCPQATATGGTLRNDAVALLVKQGRIRIEISEKNYRVIVIASGEHAGKSTLRHPRGAKPWKIIDKNGTRINGKLRIPHSSAPVSLATVRIAG